MNRVRLSGGARPPGRSPRRTTTTGGAAAAASAPRTSPRPSFRQRSLSPTTTSAASRAAASSAAGPGSTSSGTRDHAERELNRERRVREQPAGVAAARALVGPGEEQRNVERARRPRGQLDRRPVVVGAHERDEYRARTEAASDHDGHVAGRLLQQRGELLIVQKAARPVEQHEVDVLLGGDPDEVVRRRGRDERRRPRRDRAGEERRAALFERGKGRRELAGRADEAGHDQLLRRAPRERLREREQRIEELVAARRDENRGRKHRKRELRVLAQDRPLELLQGRGRLDPELLDERAPAVTVGLERLGLSARAVQSNHQLAAQALAERLLADERLELADERSVTAEGELGLDPPFEPDQPQLVEPADRRARKRLVREVGERRPAPESECVAKTLRRHRGLVRLGLVEQAREAVEVELVRPGPEHVAGRPRLEPFRRAAESLPELRDAHLQRGHARGRRAFRPELVEQPVARDDLVRVQEQEREQRPLARPAERQRPTAVGDLKRSKDPELHLVGAA